ncbi:DNA-binding response regulator, OmpR family, contains REC and winged-helix (wHTH) domain [[Eubacterium] yurii]|jgi:response regulator|nr:DNA-binding response regulator, OmpR family, contains REC and winged-helix (wHTH) domain [[Eubacterium] yurii]
MKRVLIVEDEVLIRDELALMLKKSGYKVDVIVSFNNTTRQILDFETDLILLDLNLPGESGFQICRDVKSKSSCPILVLTSRDKLSDEIYSLKLGADEYLTKPFRREKLLARIENVLKRYEGRANLLERDNFLLDKNTYTLYVNGSSVVLPQNQGKLLETFLTSDRDIVSKEELSQKLWGTSEFIDENALQVNMTRLKKAMSDAQMSHKIETVRGLGYKLVKGEDL